MTIEWKTLLGLVAATCTTLSFLPQVLKTLQTKRTKDISLGMYTILTTGIFLWLIYGFIIHDIPLILANGISFLLTAMVLLLKIRHG